jgi:pimeloyl-ACP methyl ester carboxylesterase
MISINGHNLYIQKRGLAGDPAVILLHHGLGSTRAWRRQVHPLAEAGSRVIAYDRWGYGKSDSRAAISVPCFEEDQCDLLSLLDQMKIQHTALVGHSDGGTIALYLAAAHPERITCLVTIAAHIYVEPKMQSGILSVRHAFENDAEFRSRFQRAHGGKYQQVFDNWFNGWSRSEHLTWDMRPELGRIRCPVLVIQGLEDEHATPQHAEDLAKAIPGADLWLVPGASHMLQREAAKALNQRLVEFLRLWTIDGGQ